MASEGRKPAEYSGQEKKDTDVDLGKSKMKFINVVVV